MANHRVFHRPHIDTSGHNGDPAVFPFCAFGSQQYIRHGLKFSQLLWRSSLKFSVWFLFREDSPLTQKMWECEMQRELVLFQELSHTLTSPWQQSRGSAAPWMGLSCQLYSCTVSTLFVRTWTKFSLLQLQSAQLFDIQPFGWQADSQSEQWDITNLWALIKMELSVLLLRMQKVAVTYCEFVGFLVTSSWNVNVFLFPLDSLVVSLVHPFCILLLLIV